MHMPTKNLAKRFGILLLVVLGLLIFITRGYHDEREALSFRDFKQPYSSARCLLRHCDPYSESDTRRVFLAAGGVDNDKIVFDPYSALYPPFSLVMLVPIAALPYSVAHALWEALIAATFSLAVLLVAQLCIAEGASLPLAGILTLLLAVFAASSTILLMLGQISGFVIALLVIGFWCLLRQRWLSIAAVCFFLAVLLKPHDAALPFLYLLFAGPRWRRVFVTVAVAALLCAAGSVYWFNHMPYTAHWLSELQANLHGNATADSVNNPARGHLQAVNLTDLQSLLAVVRDRPSFYNGLAALLSAGLLGVWLVPVLRLPNTRAKHLLAIAAMGCLTLLPIYHRQYDTRILLLAFPAIALLLRRAYARKWGLLGLCMLAIATVVTAHPFLNKGLMRNAAAVTHASIAKTLLMYRPLPEVLLVLLAYLLASLYREMQSKPRVTERYR